MNSAPKILFCSREIGPWMDRDEDILSKNFPTRRIFLSNGYLLKIHHWLKDLLWCDLLYVWFASYFTLPILLGARFLGKKIILVTGGYDVAKAPEIKHGTYSKSWLWRTLRTNIIKLAQNVLCVSEFNQKETILNAGVPREKTQVIYLAINAPPKHFQMSPWIERKNQVVMIASAHEGSFRTKGLDQFIALARKMPDLEFVLVGSLDSYCQNQTASIKNLKSTGFIDYHSKEFLETLSKSKVAVQLSFYESFGAAIIDAGLCGCKMLVTNRGALPEVVKPLGDVVPYGDIEALAGKVRDLLQADGSHMTTQVQKLTEKYSPVRREQALVAFIKQIFP